MDPISMIVAALVTGILSGLTRSAEDVVHEGYVELKSTILGRYGGQAGAPLVEAMDALEAEPTVTARQEAVAVELARVGADHDPELQRLASDLTSLIEDPMQRFSSPVEQAQYQAGVRAVDEVMDHHVDSLLKIRERYELEDTDLLSATSGARHAVPQEVHGEIDRLHQAMRAIIASIAQRIEDNNYRDPELAIQTMPMANAERERAASLVRADKRMHVSYLALKMTVEYFGELNRGVLRKIDRETSPEREANMMLGNAIMIFELTTFVIDFVSGFQLDGEDEIDRLYHEMKRRIADLREEHARLESLVTAPNIEPAVRAQTLEDIRTRTAAVDEVEREWDKYLEEKSAVHSMIGSVRDKVPTLEVIRENARLQIGVLQLVAVLQYLKRNTDAVKGAMDTLKGFRLAPLSPNRVRRLIGAA